MQSEISKPIVFFDGVCGLCNRFIDFLLRVDRNGIFFLAPLQGQTAKNKLKAMPNDLSTIVLLDGGRCYERSDAIARILFQLGGFWRILSFFRFIPRPLRDAAYNVVAKNRYRLFSKRETCRLPTVDERARFLE